MKPLTQVILNSRWFILENIKTFVCPHKACSFDLKIASKIYLLKNDGKIDTREDRQQSVSREVEYASWPLPSLHHHMKKRPVLCWWRSVLIQSPVELLCVI
jgi:hypothetical protein